MPHTLIRGETGLIAQALRSNSWHWFDGD